MASPGSVSLLGLQRVLFSVLFTVLLRAVRFPYWGKACKWGGGGAVGPHGGATGRGGMEEHRHGLYRSLGDVWLINPTQADRG